MAGRCEYVQMTNGSLSLYDVAVMNDLLDVKDENDARGRAATRAARDRS